MKNESAVLIGALRQAVTGSSAEFPEEIDWGGVVRLAQAHRVEALVCNGLKKSPDLWGRVPREAQGYLTRAYMQAVFFDAQLDYIRQELQKKLCEANVRHIFLKGSELKHSYPVPALRTMCDLDVLVYAEDFGTLGKIAESMGGKATHGDGNHRNYAFPNGVTVEFHPNLIHHDTPVGTQINPGWQYAKSQDKSGAMELTEEGFYLNTVCHLANHFVAGGVGVRFVLDVWVNRHLRKPEFDREVVEAELEKFGLLDFAKKIESLSELWFGEEEETQLLEELGDYILTSGSHGTDRRAMLNAVSLSPGGTRVSALLGKAFYSRAEMEDRFTWVKGKPWLLPVAWLVRAFRAVTRHGRKILQWGKGTGDFTKDEIAQQKEKLNQFGIRPKR